MDAILDIAKVLSGLFAGWLLTFLNDWLKRKRDREADAAFLAASVLIALDRFISGCADVALDDGTAYGRPAGRSDDGREEYYEAQTSIPELSWSELKVDWKSIDPSLMYSVLSIPLELEEAKGYVHGVWDRDTPPYDEHIFERQLRFAELGVRVADIAGRLREATGIPTRPPKEWNPERALRERCKELRERKAKSDPTGWF